MAIEIKVRGLSSFQGRLRRAGGRSKNLRPANLKAAILIESWTLRNMQEIVKA